MFRKLRAEAERENVEETSLCLTTGHYLHCCYDYYRTDFKSFMGMVDTVMVSNVGSAAISAVSLVDSINNLVIQVFSAMAAGLPLSAQDLSGRKTGTAVTVRHDRLC